MLRHRQIRDPPFARQMVAQWRQVAPGEWNETQPLREHGEGGFVDAGARELRDAVARVFTKPVVVPVERRGAHDHPHVVGQPFRIRALHDFIAYAKSFDDVWFATREEIAEWYLKNHHSHIA